METRDQQILCHVGLHRVSLRPIIDRLFFDGKSSGNVLKRLREQGYLQHAAKRSGFSFYGLTESGAATAGIPAYTEPGSQSIAAAYGALWFCHLEWRKDGVPRWRGSTAPRRQPTRAVAEIFLEDPPGGLHLIEAAGEKSRLLRVYAPGSKTAVARILREVEEQIERASSHPTMERWLFSRAYGFAVLLDTAAKKETVARKLKLLQQRAYCVAEHVPGPEAIMEASRAVRS